MPGKNSFRKLEGNTPSQQGRKTNGPHLCSLGCFELKLRLRLWFGGIPAEAREKSIRATHGETEKESRRSIVTTGVTFPLESNKRNQSHVWPCLLGPLLRRGVCGGDGGNLLRIGQQSGIRRLCRVRQSIRKWRPQRRHCHTRRCAEASPVNSIWLLRHHYKQFWTEFLNKSLKDHSKIFYDVSHVHSHYPPPNHTSPQTKERVYPRKWYFKIVAKVGAFHSSPITYKGQAHQIIAPHQNYFP